MRVNILGTRGIPAAHGGFETFAEKLALYLVGQGHEVLVYCQPDMGSMREWNEDRWHGVNRRFYRPRKAGPKGTMEFDLACVRDVLKQPGVDLVLGYNTAIFNVLQRLKGRRVFMNMDGIEWKRAKWSFPAKIWFFANEVIGSNLANVAIADHPEIGRHIRKRCFKKPVVIPYGSDAIERAQESQLSEFGVEKDRFLVSIARIEPENSILEMATAFSSISTTQKLVVLGRLEDVNPYHRKVQEAANSNVVFPGAVYDAEKVAALRFFCRAYLHGHQVGGTNPSLVEALGAGSAIIAHDNPFNRWVAGPEQSYFSNDVSCIEQLKMALDNDALLKTSRQAARHRHEHAFQWKHILRDYEDLLLPGERSV